MNTEKCPNYDNCQLLLIEGFVPDKNRLKQYVETFCMGSDKGWLDCKRFQTKKTWNLCPDFVLPDTALSVDEILDRFEAQEMNE